MYKKGLPLLLAAVLSVTLLTGCGKTGAPMSVIPKLDGSALEGTVEYINGRTCLLRLSSEDSHYDEEDLVYLTYATINGGMAVSVGSRVSFSYHYTSDVSEYNGEPHITVNEVSVLE